MCINMKLTNKAKYAIKLLVCTFNEFTKFSMSKKTFTRPLEVHLSLDIAQVTHGHIGHCVQQCCNSFNVCLRIRHFLNYPRKKSKGVISGGQNGYCITPRRSICRSPSLSESVKYICIVFKRILFGHASLVLTFFNIILRQIVI